jgi:hypothetical protein
MKILLTFVMFFSFGLSLTVEEISELDKEDYYHVGSYVVLQSDLVGLDAKTTLAFLDLDREYHSWSLRRRYSEKEVNIVLNKPLFDALAKQFVSSKELRLLLGKKNLKPFWSAYFIATAFLLIAWLLWFLYHLYKNRAVKNRIIHSNSRNTLEAIAVVVGASAVTHLGVFVEDSSRFEETCRTEDHGMQVLPIDLDFNKITCPTCKNFIISSTKTGKFFNKLDLNIATA